MQNERMHEVPLLCNHSFFAPSLHQCHKLGKIQEEWMKSIIYTSRLVQLVLPDVLKAFLHCHRCQTHQYQFESVRDPFQNPLIPSFSLRFTSTFGLADSHHLPIHLLHDPIFMNKMKKHNKSGRMAMYEATNIQLFIEQVMMRTNRE